ncbi:Myb-like DNA-binding domain containing protein [Tritrichomonas foetus]|uniref:Myb-like DNA-binding domain containing protein n=1 Tax=Tritrichomonas foetus TaxID=1144522 RepID=A0A1J4KF39_9EUKA|nr:Myb-like DNA-binding domain containing protein [Tritrichomonas foetus]|eukprot:OHT10055.1 Myb-like DNA-binding domain containing protein [Tritrichomonas foetus]
MMQDADYLFHQPCQQAQHITQMYMQQQKQNTFQRQQNHIQQIQQQHLFNQQQILNQKPSINAPNLLNQPNICRKNNKNPKDLLNELPKVSQSNSPKNKNHNNSFPTYHKLMWTPDEDEMLLNAVGKHGTKNWSLIASMVPRRNGKQCRERWSGMLDPDINRNPWTREEDQILIEYHSKYGNKWAKISEMLPGRSRISLRNRWGYHLRHSVKQLEIQHQLYIPPEEKTSTPAVEKENSSENIASKLSNPLGMSLQIENNKIESTDPTLDRFWTEISDKLWV